jgi:hypothetical protein
MQSMKVLAIILPFAAIALAWNAPLLAQESLTCRILRDQAETAPAAERSQLRQRYDQRCRPTPIVQRRPSHRPPPPPQDRCRTAGGDRTRFVVISHQSFDESVLGRLAGELGCDHFWFKMGTTLYANTVTNSLHLGPDTPFLRVQAAIRAAFNVGAQIRYVGSGGIITTNTIWLSHCDCERNQQRSVTSAGWQRLLGATSQEQFDSILNEVGITFYSGARPAN